MKGNDGPQTFPRFIQSKINPSDSQQVQGIGSSEDQPEQLHFKSLETETNIFWFDFCKSEQLNLVLSFQVKKLLLSLSMVEAAKDIGAFAFNPETKAFEMR
jgi:hypothetical protein